MEKQWIDNVYEKEQQLLANRDQLTKQMDKEVEN